MGSGSTPVPSGTAWQLPEASTPDKPLAAGLVTFAAVILCKVDKSLPFAFTKPTPVLGEDAGHYTRGRVVVPNFAFESRFGKAFPEAL
jgi:hypothetical protein